MQNNGRNGGERPQAQQNARPQPSQQWRSPRQPQQPSQPVPAWRAATQRHQEQAQRPVERFSVPPAKPARPAPQRRQQPAGQQARPAKKGGLVIKPRFYIFCAVCLLLVVGFFVGLGALIRGLSSSSAQVSYGRIEDVTTVNALLIRDEVSVRAEGYGSIDYLAPDRGYVTADTPILEVYATGYSGEKMAELEKLKVDITEQQKKALGDIMNVTITDYDNSISAQVQAISDAMREDPGQLSGLYRQLDQLMDARQDYVEKTTEAKEDANLAQYYANKTQLETQIDAWKTQHRASGEGIISYTFDGLEPYLNMDTLDALDAAAVKELLRDNNPAIPDELRSQQNLYRLVQPNRWYVAFTTKASTWKIGIDETCAIYFESFEDVTYTAKVKSLQATGNDLMVLLEMNEDGSALINARKLTAVIGGRVEGMMVPLGALKTVSGQQGVYKADGNVFVPVRVVGQDSKHALVMPLEAGTLSGGDKIRK